MAALDFVQPLARIPTWLSLSDAPLATTAVYSDYIGINIATSDDPAVDDYLLERLADLGIRQVRMDFSYDSLEGFAERLLGRLLDQEFKVMLEVFPPLDEAKNLYRDPGVRHRWGEFLSKVFARYANKVEIFEIGSTPNRGRWSGFSFLDYQSAWAIAIDKAEGLEVQLAGPNVSDFEPFYNASILASMARFGRSPDIHTDNLFVERVIEPEAYDHRVFGRFATHWLKLNLLKKARILALIGAENGSAELMCTYKCWTSKRLARRSPWPDQKRVDYLVRYLALAAGSGALRRVYWGPLICARDGLISDQIEAYPVIDQVSYYQKVRGELSDFTINSGFSALAHAVERFSGTQVSCLIHQPYGMSIFQFDAETANTFLLCWCRDRMSVPIMDVFKHEGLASAAFFNACGEPISQPVIIDEQPLFIEFDHDNNSPNLTTLDAEASRGVIHLSSPSHRSISDTEGDWLGAGILRADHQRQDLEGIRALRPSILPTLEETAVLRDARNRIWNVQDPRNICDQVSVKLNRVAGIKRITYRFRPSKGRRHWNNACEMIRRGVKTPLPVAFYEQRENTGVSDSWYLCEFIAGAFSARDVYGAIRDGASEFRGVDKNSWLKCLAEFTCDMHNKQIVHRDLSAGNILLTQHENGNIEPYLIDIGRAWLGNGSGLKPKHRLQDLMRICYKLNWTDRRTFVGYYETYLGKPFPSWWRVPFHYYDNKQKYKKRLKGPSKK
jgi:hypothetical protein